MIEDRRHKDIVLNPRKHPMGIEHYHNPSKDSPWREFGKKTAMLSTSERMLIHDIPRILGAGDYANLGHYFGGSAILMAKCLQEYGLSGQIYSIDIDFHAKAESRLKRFNVVNRIESCAGSTDEWSQKLSNKSFNFVFIDADHSYEAVLKDLKNWAPLVKAGGMLALHDTNQDFSHKAIEQTIAKYENWVERKDLHIHRIRTFEKIK